MNNNIIEIITTKKYFSQKTVNNTIQLLTDIDNILEINKECKNTLNKLIVIIKRGNVNSFNKNKIIKYVDILNDVFKVYYETKNNLDESESNDESDEDNDEPEESNDINELEKNLDSEIKEYEFSEINPMKGISYDKTKEKYYVKVIINDKKLNTTCKNLNDAVQKIIDGKINDNNMIII